MDNLGDFFDETHDNQFLDADKLVCECTCISLIDLVDFYGQTGTLELEELKRELGLGTGCGSCTKTAESWKKSVLMLSDKGKKYVI
jgi:NAD(P)H-nitrite reductase large subunit